ncbi:TetR/AcrR family transcriptional regulator [Paenibacillus aceris]|uniref:AcrR family transcriptional regulator n=1 Tax=Paenibacillus aceris TaxID=869555 RepID=A0ABS4I3G9_9BACL|nr:TetR/AcrR family transcriptional regulator [Paenibacillus aceris]MBP1964971.1 AcrR family transcriptional regulator [Paenibacillus aceris]NHW35632.1 TetR/AcrR family transcriptional regulator [Paenibacillus aceris]
MEPRWKQHADQFRVKIKEEILEATKELILEKGITGVTIMDISKKVGVSRVTFYKYYNSIHEITFDIQIQILSEMNEQSLTNESKGKTGAERFEDLLSIFARGFKTHRDNIRFLAIFDHAYEKQYPSPELKQKYKEKIALLKLPFIQVLQSGLEDGSLKANQPAERLALMISQALIGLMQRLATRNNLFIDNDDDNADEDAMILDDFILMVMKSMTR